MKHPSILRILQILMAAFAFLGMKANLGNYEPFLFYASISMFFNLLLIWKNSGLISTKTICSFLIYSVALVPAAAYYLMGFKLYSYVNFDHQLNDPVTLEMLRILFISSNIYTLIVLSKDRPLPNLQKKLSYVTRLSFPFLITIMMVLTYLADPSQTLITISYEEIFRSRGPFITLMNIALGAFIATTYSKARALYAMGKTKPIRYFWIAFSITLIWLVLHARRTEAIGFISILLIHQRIFTGKTPIKFIVVSIIGIFVLYLIGYLRVSSFSNLDFERSFTKALNVSFESGSDNTEFANIPAGLGNITASMQTSVYHFFYKGHEFLNGVTIYSYPVKLLPTVLYESLNLADADEIFYNNLVLEKYYYGGGTYLYAPAYGNFGTWGVYIASALMALLVNLTQNWMRSYNFIKIMMAFTVLFNFIKICWYNFLPLPKTIMYNIILLLYIALIFKLNKKSEKQIEHSILK